MARSTRIALLAALAAIAALALVLSGVSSGPGGTPGAAARSTTSQSGGPATTVPTTTPPTSASTAPPTTVPLPPYPVASTQLTVSARANNGTPVDVPTTVWYPAANVAAGPYPLLVFSPGYQIDQTRYDVLTTGWAAAGFVVAEPTYPDTNLGAPPIEYDMVNHPAELRQVITTLLQAPPVPVNSAEVAVAGQSDGGDVSLAAAAASCCKDPRIKAAVILSGAEASVFDTTYFQSGNPPLLAVQGGADPINPLACSAQLFDSAAEPRYYLDIPAADHLSAYTEAGPQLQAVLEVTTAFLDGYLLGMTAQISRLPALAASSGVSQLISGAVELPVTGSCPGAPAPA